MGWTDDLLDLVWGTCCAGCARPGRQLCRRCADRLATSPRVRRVVDGTAGTLTCTAGTTYDELVERLVPAWKNDGRTGLTRPLADRLAAALDEVALAEAEVWLVPVPSRPESLVRRGFSPPLVLARTVTRGRRHRRPLLAVGALVAPGGPGDQVGLGRLDRRRNLAGTMRTGDPRLLAELRAASRRAASVLLVDDVVTTGATLGESARALSAAGVTVTGAVVVADTPTGRHGWGIVRAGGRCELPPFRPPLTGGGRTV